jgi:putative acetyltransferase
MIEKFVLKDGKSVIIKRLLREDYEKNNNYEFVHDWLRQVNQYLLLEFEKETLEEDKEQYYKGLSDENAQIVVGAINNDKIIGSSSLQINLYRPKVKHVGTWGIAIHPDFHNQGLGTKLLASIEEIAHKRGLRKLEAEFFEGNEIAQKLYIEKLNYEIEGRRKFSCLLKDGSYVDRILIGKVIDKSVKQ